MATITNDPDAPTYIIPLLGDLVLEPGASAEVTDEEAQGFLCHPHITISGLAETAAPPEGPTPPPVADAPPTPVVIPPESPVASTTPDTATTTAEVTA